MLYTSGTTSKPKGCLITHANYIYGAEAISKATRLSSEDRHLVVLPLFHAAAQMHQTIPILLVGGSIALMERFSASRFMDQAIRYRATASALFAAPIRMILAQPVCEEHRRNLMRVVTFAQNVTEAQLAEWHTRFDAPLMQLWGMTETASLPVMNPLYGPRNNMAMGQPVLGYDVRIVDESGADMAPGKIGELIVRGEPGWTIMKGYYKNPEATASTIRDGWLYSGDRVKMDAEGFIYFVDRGKDLIKRAGENVSTGEVENALKDHPAVFDAAVIGIPDPVYDEAIKAFVILRENAVTSAEELIAWCRGRLSKSKVPSVIAFRDAFPRTSVGKIQKHLLRHQE
jgi:crotonobetaine/carnitine-CoA ligase